MKLSEILKHPLYRRSIKIIFLAAFLFLICSVFFPSGKKVYSQTVMFSTMSTLASARLYVPEPEIFEEAFQHIISSMNQVEDHLNRFNPASELSLLNRTAAEKPFVCSDMLWKVLCRAREIYQLTDGAFDITINPLMQIWDYRKKRDQLPSPEEIQQALTLVGLDKVQFNDKDQSVFFTVKGMQLDLGGIAKGYALDYAAENLKNEKNIQRGYLEIGGNALALPVPPPPRQDSRKDRIDWQDISLKFGLKKTQYSAGIRNPLSRDPGKTCGIVLLSDEAISTSGSYERFLTIQGKQYCHIINPKTGYPVENMLSVTVLTKSGMDSDALSTAIFVGGPALALELAEKMPDLKVLIFSRNPDDPENIQSFVIGKGFDFSIPEPPEPEEKKPLKIKKEDPENKAVIQ